MLSTGRRCRAVRRTRLAEARGGAGLERGGGGARARRSRGRAGEDVRRGSRAMAGSMQARWLGRGRRGGCRAELEWGRRRESGGRGAERPQQEEEQREEPVNIRIEDVD